MNYCEKCYFIVRKWSLTGTKYFCSRDENIIPGDPVTGKGESFKNTCAECRSATGFCREAGRFFLHERLESC